MEQQKTQPNKAKPDIKQKSQSGAFVYTVKLKDFREIKKYWSK